jgi:hypothetical protein
MYLTISKTEDEVYIEAQTKAELLKELAEQRDVHPRHRWKFLNFIPKGSPWGDGDWPENSMVIIKGDIVTPTVVEIATKWELP